MGKVIRALPGDTVEFSVYGMASWFTVMLDEQYTERVTLVIKDRHGKEIMRVVR